MAESERASASGGQPSSGGLKGSVQVEWASLSPTLARVTLDRFTQFFPLLRADEVHARAGAAGRREEPAADRGVEGSTSPDRERSPGGRGRGRKAPRKRRQGRRGPERFDADYYLRRLQLDVVEEVRRAGGTEREIDERIRQLQQKSSEELAAEIARRFNVNRDGRTYRRNSRLYRDWEPHREAARGGRSADRGRQPPKKTPARTQADLATAAAINGKLSQRETPNGRTHGDREAIDFKNDAMTDDFLREHGVLGDFEPL